MNAVDRRRFRPANAVLGLLFLATAGFWLAWNEGVVPGPGLGRTVAALLIVLGVAGVLVTLVAGRRDGVGRPDDREDDTLVVDRTTDEEEIR